MHTILRTPFATAVSFVLLAASAASQSFYYPDFAGAGVGGSGLNLLGDAAQSGTALRLTANAAGQSAWVWRDAPVSLEFGFETSFSFRLIPPAVGTKAEGLAFVLHQDPRGSSAQAGTAWGLGYGLGSTGPEGLRRSIAIEIDTFQDLFLGDTSDNELSIHTRGSQPNSEREDASLARTTPAVNLADGNVHSLRVTYDLATIEVFLDGAATPVISHSYNLLTGGQYASGQTAPGLALPSNEVTVGFAATTGTGTLTETAELLSWQWRSNTSRPACYDGTLLEDALLVEGQSGGADRTVRLVNSQAFGITMSAPPIFGAGAPYVLFASLLPQPGAPGTQLAFGETCFPIAPLGATELVLADTIGVFGGLLQGQPAPHTLALPAGLITSSLDFTLQAVTFATATPLALGITNAVDVEFRAGPAPVISSVLPLSAATGQPITITGTNFLAGLTLQLAGNPVPTTAVSPTSITFAYPAGAACDAQLAVINPDAQSDATTLNPQPAITNTFLNSGPAAGNAIFIVSATGLAAGTTVTIGGNLATILSITPNNITMRTPPGTPGIAPVLLTTPGGCTATTTYTYN